jgi:transcriptional regulator with XRE-family HTH domain
MMNSVRSVGELLREWRQRRRMSQLDLACEAEISPRHMSFLETGRSQPSRDMLLHLAERLEVPLRERNVLLHAAGYAPVFPERPLNDPALHLVRKAIDQLLTAHEPRPALAIDRHWTMVSANRMISHLLTGVDPALLEPPVNVLRLSLHPAGLAPRIANLAQWRAHLLERLRRQVASTADPLLHDLMVELIAYPVPANAGAHPANDEYGDIAVPFQYITPNGTLALFSTSMIFGTPVDVTLSELAIEAFFPADAATEEALRRLASGR